MIKFNPEGKDNISFKEALFPAMEIEEENEAKEYLKDLASYIEQRIDKIPDSPDDPVKIAINTIAYVASKRREGDNHAFMNLFSSDFDPDNRHPLELIRAGWQIHAVFGNEVIDVISNS
jgi:hypothetical protein